MSVPKIPVDGLTGQSVPRVRFTITAPGLVDAISGSSDAQGDLVLAPLSAGRYQLTLEKAGYFPVPYELNVTAASPVVLREIVMTGRREISGSVRWQDGEVVARAQVRVIGAWRQTRDVRAEPAVGAHQ